MTALSKNDIIVVVSTENQLIKHRPKSIKIVISLVNSTFKNSIGKEIK